MAASKTFIFVAICVVSSVVNGTMDIRNGHVFLRYLFKGQTWIGGSKYTDDATDRFPFPREGGAHWTDNKNNLWLFGGSNGAQNSLSGTYVFTTKFTLLRVLQ